MDFGLSDFQRELKTSARDFLKNECPTTFVRQAMASEDGVVRELNSKIAELGWPGLTIPERFGGLGLGMLDLAMVLEECGYASMPGAFLFSTIAATVLRKSGDDQLCKKWLPDLAKGSALGTVALPNPAGGHADDLVRAEQQSSGWKLNGTIGIAPYAHAADVIVLAAATNSGERLLFVLDRAAGFSARTLKGIDQTRRLCELKLENVKVPGEARLAGVSYDQLLNIASVAIAADSLGGTERALEMAVDYSRVREQFGKPIGSFQALKHTAAEIVADLEPARALLWYAAYALDALPDEASRAASMAKARLAEIFTRATDRAVLMFGGIGFTWEHDIHLWFKRARLNDALFGDPVFHRERVARLSGY